jgi:hypothetical protein
MPQWIKEVNGKRVTFEDPAQVHAQQRVTTRAALVAKRDKGELTVNDLHTMLELILDAQDDLLKREG